MFRPMDRIDTDILIVGGGAAGLAATALFAAEGFDVTCVDAAPPVTDAAAPGADLRTTALMTPSVEALTRAGAWAHLAPHAAPLARTPRHRKHQSFVEQAAYVARHMARLQAHANTPVPAKAKGFSRRAKIIATIGPKIANEQDIGMLLNAGASTGEAKRGRGTPLISAASVGNADCVRMLLEEGNVRTGFLEQLAGEVFGDGHFNADEVFDWGGDGRFAETPNVYSRSLGWSRQALLDCARGSPLVRPSL